MSTMDINTEGKRICPACGTVVVDSSTFCIRCGARISGMVETEAVPAKNWFTQAHSLNDSQNNTGNGTKSSDAAPKTAAATADRSDSSGSTFIKPVKGPGTASFGGRYSGQAAVPPPAERAGNGVPAVNSESRCKKCGTIVSKGTVLCWKCASASPETEATVPSVAAGMVGAGTAVERIEKTSASRGFFSMHKKLVLITAAVCVVLIGCLVLFFSGVVQTNPVDKFSKQMQNNQYSDAQESNFSGHAGDSADTGGPPATVPTEVPTPEPTIDPTLKELIENPEFPKKNWVSKLSKDCDRVLSRGLDSDGTLLELVGYQEESVHGFTIKIGVIKNGEWLITPTDQSPFLMSDGRFPDRQDLLKLETKYVYFIDGGCFLLNIPECCAIILNCNTLESRQSFKKSDATPIVSNDAFIPSEPNSVPNFEYDQKDLGYFYDYVIPTDEGKCIYTARTNNGYDEGIYYIDISTLESRRIMELPHSGTIGDIFDHYIPASIGRLSEGLFCTYLYDDYGRKHIEFYDINGIKVISLNDYDFRFIKWTTESGLHFEDGLFCFIAANELGTEYKITINRLGEIVNEEEYYEPMF